MPIKTWYIHLLGETFGPLPEATVSLFLKQGRLSFVDFAWSDGLGSWTRVFEIPTFADLMPTPPKTAPPKKDAAGTVSSPAKPLPAEIEGTVRFENGDIARILQLTERAVFLKVSGIKSAKELGFTLDVPSVGEPMKLTGVVVSSSEAKGTEIEFTRLNPAYRRLIQTYATNQKKNSRAA